SIFENATEGIYQTTPEGQFITANTAMAAMLGYDSPEELMSTVTDIAGQLYVNPEERTKLIQMIKDAGQVKSFETRFYRKDGRMIWVSINIRAVCDKKGEFLNYDGIAEDISERKKEEQRQILINKILEALNRQNEIINLIRDILLLLKEYTGIEAIGIRLREGDDFPYYVTSGFPESFLEAENYLCTRDNTGEIIRDSQGNPCLECMCGNILCGRTDPTFPFFTEGGSFWANSATELLASTSGEDRQALTRNRCNSEGYESVALIPLRSGDETIGLLQLNDSRRDSLTIEMIRFFEGIGATIGIAVARKRSVEALSIKTMLLEAQSETSIDGILAVDNEGHTILFNKRFCELWKIPQHILDTKDDAMMLECVLKQLKDPEEFGRKVAYLYEHRSEKSREEIEFADGRYLDRYSSPLLSIEGQYLGRIWFFRDITDRKRAEEWLLRERSMVDRIMKTSPAGITVVDRKGQIVFANKRAEDIFCLTKNEITQLGYSASEWHSTDFDGNPFPEEQFPFTKVMNTGNPVYGVRHAIELSGRQRVFLSINGAPIFDEQGHVSEVVMTIDDITKYRQAEEKIQQSIKKLEKSMGDTIKAMSIIVETRDPYTAGHQAKVARLAAAIAEKLNLSEEIIRGIQMAGVIHDIGKMYIPAEILSKPGKLSIIEMQLIRTHAQAGYDIMKDVEFPWPVARIILEHHERMDGSGYPNGRSSNDILLEARIIAIADVVDAMASHRPYRPSLGTDMALREIEKSKGVLYDSDVVDACLMLFREEGFQLEGI
ncbi:MAG: PAS domain S-box protein, partial [Deltaproteobacteria bacterium]|nr:PAS domain S-box protein [Deltaproteobacteria bacterium]